ncbi:MAG: hypothetical protein FRX49_00365 [Trebouxia sp. A1-2]|nr:MAG: hypothetical protein FRX49_00365 [Trebouxia sp. A1-2]
MAMHDGAHLVAVESFVVGALLSLDLLQRDGVLVPSKFLKELLFIPILFIIQQIHQPKELSHVVLHRALSLLRPVRFLLLALSASSDNEEVSKLLSLFASAKLTLTAAVLLGCLLDGAAAALDLLLLPLRVLRHPSAFAAYDWLLKVICIIITINLISSFIVAAVGFTVIFCLNAAAATPAALV